MADGFLSGLARRAADLRDDWRDRAEDYGREGARRGRDLAGEGYRRGRDLGDEGYRRARDLGEEGYRRARDLGEQGYRRARGYAEEGYELARDRGGDAMGELRRLWSQLEDVVEREVGPGAVRYARRAGTYAREGAVEAADTVRSFARNRPLLALGIAAGAAWLVAGLLRGGGDRDRRR